MKKIFKFRYILLSIVITLILLNTFIILNNYMKKNTFIRRIEQDIDVIIDMIEDQGIASESSYPSHVSLTAREDIEEFLDILRDVRLNYFKDTHINALPFIGGWMTTPTSPPGRWISVGDSSIRYGEVFLQGYTTIEISFSHKDMDFFRIRMNDEIYDRLIEFSERVWKENNPELYEIFRESSWWD